MIIVFSLCSMFYWLTDDALLIYYVIVNCTYIGSMCVGVSVWLGWSGIRVEHIR